MEPVGDILKRAQACQSLFTQCSSNPRFSELDWFDDRRGVFNLWVASLEPRLDCVRDRPEVRELICDLLGGLSEALKVILQTGMADFTLKF